MDEPTPQTPSPSPSFNITDIFHESASLDFNIVVIIAAVTCAIVCALGLNSMLHCILKCAFRALTEPIGWFASRRLNSGLSKKDVVALPTSVYVGSSSLSCAICLVEFCDGDELRVLPKCNHQFHVGCIDKWLMSHSSCPSCRLHLKARANCVSCSEILVSV